MKKSIKFVCLILVLNLLLTFPVHAASEADPRGSAFFSAYGAALYKLSPTAFEIWFDVDSNAAVMQEIGVSLIEVYQSYDGEHWTLLKTYEKEDYPQMIDYNTGSHTGYVTYTNAAPGYYYYACVTFYAKNSYGIGENFIYTEIIRTW